MHAERAEAGVPRVQAAETTHRGAASGIISIWIAFITGLATGGCLALQGGLLASSLTRRVEAEVRGTGLRINTDPASHRVPAWRDARSIHTRYESGIPHGGLLRNADRYEARIRPYACRCRCGAGPGACDYQFGPELDGAPVSVSHLVET